MTGAILRGREIADRILAGVAERAATLSQRGITPALAFVSVGDSEEGRVYRQRLEKLASPRGVKVSQRLLPETATAIDLRNEMRLLGEDDAIDGILVELPLPSHLESVQLATLIDPRKDVDGITVENVGRLHLRLPGHVPSTAVAMMEILDAAGIDPTGKRAVVVGRSNVVGRPVAELLVQRNATVTVAHTRTVDLPGVTREAEILMVAAGKPGVVTADMIRPGVVIIDAGINVVAGEIVGDVVFDACLPIASAITPVPGGVGPVTNAVLLRSVVESAGRRD